jgi:hypothetical protein
MLLRNRHIIENKGSRSRPVLAERGAVVRAFVLQYTGVHSFRAVLEPYPHWPRTAGQTLRGSAAVRISVNCPLKGFLRGA